MDDGAGKGGHSLTLGGKVADPLFGLLLQIAKPQRGQRALGLFGFGRAAGLEDGKGDVFQDAQGGKKGAGREKKSDMSLAQRVAGGSRQFCGIDPAEPDLAGIGLLEQSEHMEQEVLPAALRTADGMKMAGFEDGIHAPHVRITFAPEWSDALQFAAMEQGGIHCEALHHASAGGERQEESVAVQAVGRHDCVS